MSKDLPTLLTVVQFSAKRGKTWCSRGSGVFVSINGAQWNPWEGRLLNEEVGFTALNYGGGKK